MLEFALEKNPEAEVVLRRWLGCCCQVWNLAVMMQKRRLSRGEGCASYAVMAKWLTWWRSDPGFVNLAEPPVHALQGVLHRLDRELLAYAQGGGAFPSLCVGDDPFVLRESDRRYFSVDPERACLRFPKLGWLHYVPGEVVPDRPKVVSLRLAEDGRWLVAMDCDAARGRPLSLGWRPPLPASGRSYPGFEARE